MCQPYEMIILICPCILQKVQTTIKTCLIAKLFKFLTEGLKTIIQIMQIHMIVFKTLEIFPVIYNWKIQFFISEKLFDIFHIISYLFRSTLLCMPVYSYLQTCRLCLCHIFSIVFISILTSIIESTHSHNNKVTACCLYLLEINILLPSGNIYTEDGVVCLIILTK